MTTVTNQIIQVIRRRILEGHYPPGSRLQEAQTATELSVSRTPIREAFRALANDHLLVYRPNRGYVVRDVELQDVLDAYDLRGAIDGLAARTIAERGFEGEELARFEELVRRGNAVLTAKRWGLDQHHAMFELERDFSRQLIETSRNVHLEAVLRQIRLFPRLFDSRLQPESPFFIRAYPRDRWEECHRLMAYMVEAMTRREGTRAESLAREFAYLNREILRSSLKDEELLGAAATDAA